MVYSLVDNELYYWMAIFGVFYSIGILCMFFGIWSGGKLFERWKFSVAKEQNADNYIRIAIVLFAIQLTFEFFALEKAGEIEAFAQNISARASMLAGTAVF